MGKRVEREKKLFNSYIIIEADLTPELIFFCCRAAWRYSFPGKWKETSTTFEHEINRLLGISDRDKSETET
jgi:transcription antitermination factor NusG